MESVIIISIVIIIILIGIGGIGIYISSSNSITGYTRPMINNSTSTITTSSSSNSITGYTIPMINNSTSIVTTSSSVTAPVLEEVTCVADSSWNTAEAMFPGQKIHRKCPDGKLQIAECKEDGEFKVGSCIDKCKADNTWSNTEPVSIGESVTRKCGDGRLETAICRPDGVWDMSGCPVDCTVSGWSSCDLNTMTQTRTKITEEKNGGFCPTLIQQCPDYIRSTYRPLCPDYTQQIGSDCYKFPVGDYLRNGTGYVLKCPIDTETVGNECKKVITGYNPVYCSNGVLNGKMCQLNSYYRGDGYTTSGVIGLGGTSGLNLCNRAHNGNCESSRFDRNKGYPRCANGYSPDPNIESNCLPGGQYSLTLGPATCNPGDFTAGSINACFPQPLPGFSHQEFYSTNGQPFAVSKMVQTPQTADKERAICNPGDSYAQDGSCFPQAKEGYTCNGNECKLNR